MRSVYIHIPFCNSICSYCDFCKFIYVDEWANKYLDFLNSEIEKYYEGETVKSIYIGGGTPSCLSESNLNKLIEIVSHIKLKKYGEFTFECNVNDINETNLLILKKAGVNRLSIGVESFNKYNLKFLNRKHNKKEIFRNIELAKEIGFDNINVDLMYALPIENMFILKKDVKNILKLKPQHISTYSLIIEEHTVLKNKKILPLDDDLDFKMYRYICKKLKKSNFEHYEISNFSLNGYESEHNLTYWNNEEYYGFGLGAHGYINNIRYENTRNFNKYLNHEYRLNELLVSIGEEMENELILGLRKVKGISISKFENRFNRDIFEVFKLAESIEKGHLMKDKDNIYIPEDKMYVMNDIINNIL
ncbi:MAG: radical SAM family heme chaperone HemW [Tenericutes bacterium]|nr:radical SAM family heme chaperone HemW [Mycoplasmatota bacterium]